jgi:hypothetical protein
MIEKETEDLGIGKKLAINKVKDMQNEQGNISFLSSS